MQQKLMFAAGLAGGVLIGMSNAKQFTHLRAKNVT